MDFKVKQTLLEFLLALLFQLYDQGQLFNLWFLSSKARLFLLCGGEGVTVCKMVLQCLEYSRSSQRGMTPSLCIQSLL